MSYHIFGSDNLLDNAHLSMLVGTENSQFPLSNLKVPITGKVFRANGSEVEFVIDTGTYLPVDTFMVVGDNVEGMGVSSISIYGSSTWGFEESTEIPVSLSLQHNFGYARFTENHFRYWRVVLKGSTYCEVSNIYLGKAVTFKTNAIDLGSFRYLKKENQKTSENKYGTRFINQYNSQKTLSGSLKLLNTTEYNTLRDIYNDNKRTKPLWVMIDPEDKLETDGKYIYSGYFYLNKDVDFKNTHFGLWSTSMTLEEVV